MASASARLTKVSEWFESNGGWLCPSVELSFSKSKGTLLRVKDDAKTKLATGTKVISCPHSLTLSALNALGLEPTFRKAKLVFGDAGSRDLDLPAAFVTTARQQCIAAVILATQKYLNGLNTGQGFWDAYIECLPSLPIESSKENGSDDSVAINTPMWWGESQLTSLGMTNVEKGLRDLKCAWKEEWERWSPVLLPWATSHGIELSWELYKWSLSILDSRAFGSSQIAHVVTSDGVKAIDELDPDMLLYPVFDMLNHDPKTMNHWHSDADVFYLICEDEPGPGDEIFSYYGPKSNDELLLSYGFCLKNNPFESIPLKLVQKEKDFYAQFVQDESTNDSLSWWSENLDQSQSFADPKDESSYGNSRTPLPQDSKSGTFYVRSLDIRNKYDKRFGYPRSAKHRNELQRWKSAFPEAFLSFLALKVANKRESAYAEGQRQSIKSPNLYKHMGLRNEAAVASNLLLILQVESKKLQTMKRESPAKTSNEDMDHVQIYRTEKERMSRECIHSLQAYLGRVTGTLLPSDSQGNTAETKKADLLTMPHAYALLGTIPSPFSTVTRLFLHRIGITIESFNEDVEMILTRWIFCIGLIIQIPVHFPNPHSPDSDAHEEILSRCKMVTSRFPTLSQQSSKKSQQTYNTNTSNSISPGGEEEETLVGVMQRFLTRTRNAAPGRFRVDEEANPLRPSFWTDAFIEAAQRFVEDEIVDVSLTWLQRRRMNEQWKKIFPSLELGEATTFSGVQEDDGRPVPVLYFPTERQEEDERNGGGSV